MTVIEGAWDCSQCQKIGIPGREKECPECGDPRNAILTPEEKPYFPKGAREVTDPSELELARAGPDWNCGHCGKANRGTARSCEGCGKPLDYDDTVGRRIRYDTSSPEKVELPDPMSERIEDDLERATRVVEGKGEVPRRLEDLTVDASLLRREGELAGRVRGYLEDMQDDDESLADRFNEHFTSPPKAVLIGGGVVVALVVVVVAFFGVRYFTASVTKDVTVEKLTWERRVEVEQYKTLTKSDWDYPSDARVLDSSEEIREYRTVIDDYRTEHYTGYESRSREELEEYDCSTKTDTGNGYLESDNKVCTRKKTVFEQVPVQKTRRVPITHEEPIYGTMYTYQVDRWVTSRWVESNGEGKENVRWPEPSDLKRGEGSLIGKERIGDVRLDAYKVYVKDDQKRTHDQEVDFNTWKKLNVGEKIPAKFNKRTDNFIGIEWELVS